MPFQMQPGRTLGSAGNVPDVATLLAGALTCSKGQLIKDSSGTAIIHPLTGTVLLVYGVSLEADVAGVADGPDSSILHIARAERETEFVSKCVTSSVIETDLSGVSVGDTYGIITVSNQDYVDLSDTSDVLVTITKVDDDINIVWFTFLPSTLDPAE